MKTSQKLVFFTLLFFFFNFLENRFCHAQSAKDSLTYYGHAFVKIKTAQGMVIYIDPFAVNAFADSADVVLITHEHSDHNEIHRVKQKPGCQVIRASNTISGNTYNTFTIGSVTIQGFPAYNRNHARTSCVGYIVSFNGIKVYHAGDTGLIPEMAELASQQITYALLPMDGVYTMTPEEATIAASRIQAAHDIPIHTMPPPDTYSDAIVARFTSPNKLIVRPGSTIALVPAGTKVHEASIVPTGFRLEQNYPNPFNSSTTISFYVPKKEWVSVKIFDLLGREVETLVSDELAPGAYTSQWDASRMPSGVYFYRLQAGSFSETRKLVVLK